MAVPMRVGFHVEGWDHLILRALLARLLDLAEEEIHVDLVEMASRGWQSVLEVLPLALNRFYYGCAQFAVVGIDNDGNEDLVKTGCAEDPRRPRHWNHAPPHPDCRHCKVARIVDETRARLHGLSQKPPAEWPILLAVPVESIESWLLSLKAIEDGAGDVYVERKLRSSLKMELYRMPDAPRAAVERVALPLVRAAAPEQLQLLRQVCRSFDSFAAQVDAAAAKIHGPRDCFAPGDNAAGARS
jgi:hypothetical protein